MRLSQGCIWFSICFLVFVVGEKKEKRHSTDKETCQLEKISPELFWGGTKIALAWLVQKHCFSMIPFPLMMLQCFCHDMASSCAKILVLKMFRSKSQSHLTIVKISASKFWYLAVQLWLIVRAE